MFDPVDLRSSFLLPCNSSLIEITHLEELRALLFFLSKNGRSTAARAPRTGKSYKIWQWVKTPYPR